MPEKRIYRVCLDSSFLCSGPAADIINAMPDGAALFGTMVRMLVAAAGPNMGFMSSCFGGRSAESYIAEAISADIDLVSRTLRVLLSTGIAELLDDGSIIFPMLSEIQESVVGSALRQRKSRQKKASESQCNNVTPKRDNVTESRNSVTAKRDNVTNQRNKVTAKRDKDREDGNQGENPENHVTESRNKVTAKRENVTKQRNSVTAKRDNVTNQRNNVTNGVLARDTRILHITNSIEEWKKDIKESVLTHTQEKQKENGPEEPVSYPFSESTNFSQKERERRLQRRPDGIGDTAPSRIAPSCQKGLGTADGPVEGCLPHERRPSALAGKGLSEEGLHTAESQPVQDEEQTTSLNRRNGEDVLSLRDPSGGSSGTDIGIIPESGIPAPASHTGVSYDTQPAPKSPSAAAAIFAHDRALAEPSLFDALPDVKEELAKAAAEGAGDIDFRWVREQYNTLCPSLAKCMDISENRKRRVRAIVEKFGLDGLLTIFRNAEASDFLSGRSGEATRKFDFDFVVRQEQATRLYEGGYANRKPKKAETGRFDYDTAYPDTDFRPMPDDFEGNIIDWQCQEQERIRQERIRAQKNGTPAVPEAAGGCAGSGW